MSQNYKRAGRITGSPLCGLCERVCIQTKRVLDGCIFRVANIEFSINITAIPLGFVAPYTFVKVYSIGGSVVQSVNITQLQNSESRVRANIVTPVAVAFTDANGLEGVAQGEVVNERDIVLSLPSASLSPYQIECSTAIEGSRGAFSLDNSTANVIGCIIQVVRATAVVEILVPSYGYCEYPDCEEYGGRVCRSLFSRPIFPSP